MGVCGSILLIPSVTVLEPRKCYDGVNEKLCSITHRHLSALRRCAPPPGKRPVCLSYRTAERAASLRQSTGRPLPGDARKTMLECKNINQGDLSDSMRWGDPRRLGKRLQERRRIC